MHHKISHFLDVFIITCKFVFFFLPIFDKKIVFLRLISRLVSFFLEETEGLLNTASKHTKNLL
jgi:hypothetical protein